ncbi:MAG: N-acetylmuramic acid 6-phosphate etherase [Ruminococcaceae bacterium]|nr:N-acetylmuramic acid 6-phosphate etherase [Oscillospiraceae bacterium]
MLNTEKRNSKTTHIDKMSTSEMLKVMQEENINAAKAVETELESIGLAIDAISERMKKGGRLFYVGCGTSGRLGVLDASECPPTYGVSYDTVIGIMAGGDKALRQAGEADEDSYEAGCRDLIAYNLTPNDSVIGISVAGGASFVIGALESAKAVGALTVALSCNCGCPIERIADISIHPDTGAEVITGSTRMKAGTAHKMIINMISTAVMIKQGHVYENLMVNLEPSNVKLRDRMIRITSDITGFDYKESEALLVNNDFNIKKSIENSKKFEKH